MASEQKMRNSETIFFSLRFAPAGAFSIFLLLFFECFIFGDISEFEVSEFFPEFRWSFHKLSHNTNPDTPSRLPKQIERSKKRYSGARFFVPCRTHQRWSVDEHIISKPTFEIPAATAYDIRWREQKRKKIKYQVKLRAVGNGLCHSKTGYYFRNSVRNRFLRL